jgi:RecA/RadA recombinase
MSSADRSPSPVDPEVVEKLRHEMARRLRPRGLSAGSESSLTTGVPDLDLLLPGGGIPRGELTEITGPPSSGKTALLVRLLARALERGEVAVYLDTTGSFDSTSVLRAGLPLKRLLLVRPPSVAVALQVLEELLRSRGPGLLALDLAGLLLRRGLTQATLFRLVRVVREVDAAVVLLRDAVPGATSLGSAVGLRLFCRSLGCSVDPSRPGAFRMRVEVAKSRQGSVGGAVDLELDGA